MLLERLTLVALFISVALAGCSDAAPAPAAPSTGNQPDPVDTGDGGRRFRGPDRRVALGSANPIVPRGVRFTVLQGDPAKQPDSPRR
jgi:hypothetical protein